MGFQTKFTASTCRFLFRVLPRPPRVLKPPLPPRNKCSSCFGVSPRHHAACCRHCSPSRACRVLWQLAGTIGSDERKARPGRERERCPAHRPSLPPSSLKGHVHSDSGRGAPSWLLIHDLISQLRLVKVAALRK